MRIRAISPRKSHRNASPGGDIQSAPNVFMIINQALLKLVPSIPSRRAPPPWPYDRLVGIFTLAGTLIEVRAQGGRGMKSSLWFIAAVTSGLTLGMLTTITCNRVAFGPTSAIAQDDSNSDYDADQARQRDEDAQQQQQYQQEQEQQQQENARQQDEYQREQEEQRHQEEMDRINSEREEQQN